ncbi:hypothetical protein JCM17846_08680 [Iodidimonas nitroreducens]|uniref:Uncharacterized protein n=1 Tax=Iodidimonas nitroreducens TaxID=1236968 RepID=A0A5A7N862_9PROT|nr:hypothetical protein [Iodidimonas nitroreducens]GER03186.1 hypothetical protein JCM17846_08680 [Iodidimonas nitroreducens]
MRVVHLLSIFLITSFMAHMADAHPVAQTKAGHHDAFRQLEEQWPGPNSIRAASGAPGHEYWQQYVHYKIDVRLMMQISGSKDGMRCAMKTARLIVFPICGYSLIKTASSLIPHRRKA